MSAVRVIVRRMIIVMVWGWWVLCVVEGLGVCLYVCWGWFFDFFVILEM